MMSNKTMPSNKTVPGFIAGLLATGLAALIFSTVFSTARADDGIWLWNQRPKAPVGASGATGASGSMGDQARQKHSLEVSDAFADNLRLATVRLNNGVGSGSFVSANGLVVTNQHLVAACIAKLST